MEELVVPRIERKPGLTLVQFMNHLNVFSIVFSSLVPEYNVVHPIQVDEEGGFVSHELSYPRIRIRRSSDKVDHREEVHYKVSAFGNDFHLHLQRNRRLLAPDFKVEVIGKNGRVMKRHTLENCHYVGKLKARSTSTVAISNCQGLVRTAYELII